MGHKKFLGVALCLALLIAFAAPAYAGDRVIDKRDLEGISPKHHKYLFSVLGGAAVGAGIGALLSGGNDITKGMLIGGGGMSSLYLHSHRRAGGSLRDWAFIASHTALGSGLGWTLCGCNDGLVAGALIGGGGSAVWRAMAPQKGLSDVAKDVRKAPEDLKDAAAGKK